MSNRTLIVLALLSCFALSGCAPISLIGTWKDPGAFAKQYRTLLVVGVADDAPKRQVFEDIFAAELRKRGVAAISSYTITGGDAKLSRAALEDAVKKSSADGVVTTRVVSVKQDTRESTEYVITDRGYSNTALAEQGLMPADLYGYYGQTVQYASFTSQRVDVVRSTVSTVETNIFDAGTGKMVWSGTLRGKGQPEGIIAVSGEIAELAIKAMSRDGLI
jgi:hypothetical protein